MSSIAGERQSKTDLFAYENLDWYRLFLLRLRYRLPLDSYEGFANIVSSVLNEELRFHAVNAGAENAVCLQLATQIRRDGLAPLGSLLTRTEVDEVVRYLSQHQVYDGWSRVKGDFPLGQVPKEISVGHIHVNVLPSCPHLVYLANHPRVLSCVSQFLGTTPTLQYFSLWWSFADRAEPRDAQLFHIDRHCYRFVKLFIFLTDVDMDSGPHVYAQGSADRSKLHERFEALTKNDPVAKERFNQMMQMQRKKDEDVTDFFGADNIKYVTGAAGSSFLINTAGIHKGLPPKSTNRLIFQALYTMLPTIKDPIESIEMPDFVASYKRRFGEIMPADQLRYINRLVIRGL